MSNNAKQRYEQRIQRVCEYIYEHLDGDLSLIQLSKVAAFSAFHFHRVFTSVTGKSLAKFIQLARLRRAAYRVAFEPDTRFTELAFDAGFDSLEAFSRAFKREFQQSPSQFRLQPDWPRWHGQFQFFLPNTGEKTMDVNIVDFPETRVALLEHRGPPDTVLETAAKFIAWRKASGLSPVKTSKTFGVPYSDPNLTPPEEFRWDVCGAIDSVDVPNNEYGVISGTLPGGRCAVVRHRGSQQNLDSSIYYLYRDWLPGSGEEAGDFPCFFHYVTLIHEVAECDLITDIYLPLK